MMKHPRSFWAATTLAMVVLAGCGATSTPHGGATNGGATKASATPFPSPTLVPTATTVLLPLLALPWQSHPLTNYPWAFAPSDGATLYSCDQDAHTAIFTHDGGAKTQTTTVPVADHGGWCTLLADEGQANVAVIKNTSNGHGPYLAHSETAPFSAPGPGTEMFDLVTRDGGQSWATIPNNVIVAEAATGSDVTYAILATTQGPNDFHLARSRDGFASWQSLNPPNFSGADVTPPVPYQSQQAVQHLWVNPDGQHLLYVNRSNASFTTSTDGGQTWQAITSPIANFIGVVVQPPTVGHSWFMCAWAMATLQCTRDSGATWAAQTPPGQSTTLFGITSAGDLLAVGFLSPATESILRLPAGSNQWQSLGQAPSGDLRYFPAPSTGVLWANSDGHSTLFPTQGWYETSYNPK